MTTAAQRMSTDASDVPGSLMLIDGKAVESVTTAAASTSKTRPRAPSIARVPRGGRRRRRSRRSGRRARIRDLDASSRAMIAAGCCCASRISSRPRLESLARTVALETGNAIRTQARPEVKGTVDVYPVLRRRRGRDRKARRFRSASTCSELHAPRADRRGRRHRAVERSGRARHAEDCDGDRRGQHAGAEGRRRRAARACCASRRSATTICRLAC